MTTPIDIRADHLRIVHDVLARHLPDGVRVWVFGSRATWATKDSSDLDLALEGDGEIPARSLAALESAFEDSDLPYAVDVVDVKRIGERFQETVRRHRVPLPEGDRDRWRETTLGDVITLKRGYDLPQRQRVHGPVPVVSSSGITDHHRESRVSGPGVVTGRYGTLGSVFFIQDDFWPLNTALYVQDFKGNDPRFITYFLRSLDFSACSDKAAVPGLNRNHLHEEPARVPVSIDEQRAIAHILGTLDDKIELNRRMNATLETMARALFRSWFVDFDPVRAKMEGRDAALPKDIADMFPSRMVNSELGEIPVGWEVSPLGDLLDLAYGSALKAHSRQHGNGPVYGSSGRVGWHDTSLVRGPGIVVGRKGNPGTVTWVPTDFFPIDTTFYVVPKDYSFTWHFLFFALKVQDLPAIATDSVVPGLNRNLAYTNKQIVPPSQIVKHFDEYVGPVFTRSCQLGAESLSLVLLRDTLLPRLISGDLRLKDTDSFLRRTL